MNEEYLKIELAYPKRPGGQYVGMPRMDIKVTHIPSGNFVVVGSERSQLANRNLALSMIELMLSEMKIQNW